MLKDSDYVRIVGAVVMATAVLIAFLIPALICVGDSCSSVSFYRALTHDLGSLVDFRWPVRVGTLGLGAVLGLLLFRYADTQDRASEHPGSG